MSNPEKVLCILGWIDQGYILRAVKSFCNDLDEREQEFLFSLLGELRRKVKQQT